MPCRVVRVPWGFHVVRVFQPVLDRPGRDPRKHPLSHVVVIGPFVGQLAEGDPLPLTCLLGGAALARAIGYARASGLLLHHSVLQVRFLRQFLPPRIPLAVVGRYAYLLAFRENMPSNLFSYVRVFIKKSWKGNATPPSAPDAHQTTHAHEHTHTAAAPNRERT